MKAGETIDIGGVTYVAQPRERGDCVGCAGNGVGALCDSLPCWVGDNDDDVVVKFVVKSAVIEEPTTFEEPNPFERLASAADNVVRLGYELLEAKEELRKILESL